MRIPTLHQQMFGDINKRLANIRARMNEEVRERYLELSERKKELAGGDANGP